MQNDTLEDLYFTALRKMHHGEKQLVDALPEFIEHATHDDFANMLQGHHDTVRGHHQRLQKILDNAAESSARLENFGVNALIEEAKAVIGAYDRGEVQDAALIAVMQHIDHYKIACYGSLSTYAKMLGRDAEYEALVRTRDDEQHIDGRFTEMADELVNVNARSA